MSSAASEAANYYKGAYEGSMTTMNRFMGGMGGIGSMMGNCSPYMRNMGGIVCGGFRPSFNSMGFGGGFGGGFGNFGFGGGFGGAFGGFGGGGYF